MRSLLEKFSVADNEKRRNFIIEKLENLNCPYFIQREKIGGIWIQNIIVKLRRNNPRIILGAHYDTFEENNMVSTGANDNGSGVCVILKLLEEYIKAPQTLPQMPVEFVFFDAEEGRLFGSQAYLNRVLEIDIKAMINLDSCGVGDTIVIAPKKNIQGDLGDAVNAIDKLGKYNTKIIGESLTSDELSFERRGINNIAVCTLDENDIEIMEELAALKQGEEPKRMPTILETMHNGCRDSIDCIDDKAMEMTLNWVKDVLATFK